MSDGGGKGTVRVLVTAPLTDAQVGRVQAVSPRLRVDAQRVNSAAEAAAALAERPQVEVLFAGGLPEPWEPGGALRWVQTGSAGVDSETGKALWRHADVAITSMNGIHGPVISEWVAAMMLHHAHRLDVALGFKHSRAWPDHASLASHQGTLIGKVLGIVGYGSIGRECARLGRAFGMRILATRRTEAAPGSGAERFVPSAVKERLAMDDRVEMVPLADLRTLLAECDYVVVAAPATAETRHMIGADELAAMKPTAFLLNVARGSLVDEAALADALRDGHLAGAALDVFEREPLPADSPLFDLPNVFLTPHIAGGFDQYWDLATEAFCENLGRYLAGRPLLNVVDRDRSY